MIIMIMVMMIVSMMIINDNDDNYKYTKIKNKKIPARSLLGLHGGVRRFLGGIHMKVHHPGLRGRLVG